MTPLLAVDPGASGGLAWRDRAGLIHAEPMPKGMTAQVERLRALAAELGGLTAIVERAGYWHRGDHPNSACAFARHCGQLEAALYAFSVPFRQIPPAKWMKALGTWPKDKPARKRAIREEMARRHPHLTVTLVTADALGLLCWALENAT